MRIKMENKQKQFIVFDLGKEKYGVEIFQVKER